MLRRVLIGFGCLLLAVSALLVLAGVRNFALFWTLVWGLVFTVGILCERRLYKRVRPVEMGGGWVETGERFIDPETGRPVTVWYRPATGERDYVGPGTPP